MMMFMLITALTSTTNAESPRYGPKVELLNEIESESGHYHAFINPQYLGQMRGEAFRQAMINLFDESLSDEVRFRYFNQNIQGFHPRQMMEIYRQNLMYILQTDKLSNAEMMEVYRHSVIKPAPTNLGNQYQVGRIPSGGGLDLFYRTPYRKGDKMLNGKICQADEEGLWLVGTFNGITMDVMHTSDVCFNAIVPLENPKPPSVVPPSSEREEDPGRYSKKPVATDTFIVNSNANAITNTTPSVYIVTLPAPTAPATPPNSGNFVPGNTGQQTEIVVRQKRDFLDYANLVFNGATAVSTVKMAFFPGRRYGYNNQVYTQYPQQTQYPQYPQYPPYIPPYIPPTTGGHQGSSGGGYSSGPVYYPPTTGGTSTGGGYSNQW